MRLLFAISGSSFCAVLFVVFAVARRIRRRRALAAKAPQRRFTLHAQEFFEAGEFRTPRPLRLEQEIFKQKPRLPLSKITFPAEQQTPKNPAPTPAPSAAKAGEAPRGREAIAIRPSAGFATLLGETVPIKQFAPQLAAGPRVTLSAPSEPSTGAIRLNPSPASAPADFASQRMPPQPERASGLRSGIPPSGSAGDPFRNPLLGSGTRGLVANRLTGQ